MVSVSASERSVSTEQWPNLNIGLLDIYLRQGGYVFAGFCLFVCLSVSQQDNSKNYGRIFLKF